MRRLLLLLLTPVHQCGGAGGGAHGRWAECSGALAATLVFLLWLTGGLREIGLCLKAGGEGVTRSRKPDYETLCGCARVGSASLAWPLSDLSRAAIS